MSYVGKEPIPVVAGGTGAASFTAHAPIAAGSTSTAAFEAIDSGLGTAGFVCTSNGSGAKPSFQAVSASGAVTTLDGNFGAATPSSGIITISGGSTGLTTSAAASTVTMAGTLIVGNGGTGVSTMTTAYAPVCAGTTATGPLQVASTGLSTSGFVLTSTGNASLPTFQSVSASGAVTSVTGNSGGAEVPSSGNFNILGTGSITVAGSANTETVQLTGLTNHNVLLGAGTATITNVAPSATSGVPLISQGASADPTFGTAVVAGGGTGVTSTTAYAVLCGGTTSTAALQSIASVGTSGQVLTSNGAGALPTFQAVQFPMAFSVLYSSNANNVTGDGTAYTLVYDTALINRGSFYNTANGNITAPSAGLYNLYGMLTVSNLIAAHTALNLQYDNGAGDQWFLYNCNPFAMVQVGGSNWLTISFAIPVYLSGGTFSTVHTIILTISGGTKTVGVISSGSTTGLGMFGPV